MTRPARHALRALLALAAALASMSAAAHSASDAYLTLIEQPRTPATAGAQTVIHGQWDIALRDLDFVLRLDDNGDGNIVWGELRRHQQAIAEYAYPNLQFSGDGRNCHLSPTRQMVDDHADGAYASLMFDVICAAAPRRLTLDYRLFFAIDPSHRVILVFRNGADIATSVLSPDKARIDLQP
jgi:hypothetical protein